MATRTAPLFSGKFPGTNLIWVANIIVGGGALLSILHLLYRALRHIRF